MIIDIKKNGLKLLIAPFSFLVGEKSDEHVINDSKLCFLYIFIDISLK